MFMTRAGGEEGGGNYADNWGKTQSRKQSQNDYLNLIVFYLCQPWHLFSQMDLLGTQHKLLHIYGRLPPSISPSLCA